MSVKTVGPFQKFRRAFGSSCATREEFALVPIGLLGSIRDQMARTPAVPFPPNQQQKNNDERHAFTTVKPLLGSPGKE